MISMHVKQNKNLILEPHFFFKEKTNLEVPGEMRGFNRQKCHDIRGF